MLNAKMKCLLLVTAPLSIGLALSNPTSNRNQVAARSVFKGDSPVESIHEELLEVSAGHPADISPVKVDNIEVAPNKGITVDELENEKPAFEFSAIDENTVVIPSAEDGEKLGTKSGEESGEGQLAKGKKVVEVYFFSDIDSLETETMFKEWLDAFPQWYHEEKLGTFTKATHSVANKVGTAFGKLSSTKMLGHELFHAIRTPLSPSERNTYNKLLAGSLEGKDTILKRVVVSKADLTGTKLNGKFLEDNSAGRLLYARSKAEQDKPESGMDEPLKWDSGDDKDLKFDPNEGNRAWGFNTKRSTPADQLQAAEEKLIHTGGLQVDLNNARVQFQSYQQLYEALQGNASALILPLLKDMVNGNGSRQIKQMVSANDSTLVNAAAWSIYIELTGAPMLVVGPFMGGRNCIRDIEDKQLGSKTRTSTEALLKEDFSQLTSNQIALIQYYTVHEILIQLYETTYDKAYAVLKSANIISRMALLDQYLKPKNTSIYPADYTRVSRQQFDADLFSP